MLYCRRYTFNETKTGIWFRLFKNHVRVYEFILTVKLLALISAIFTQTWRVLVKRVKRLERQLGTIETEFIHQISAFSK